MADASWAGELARTDDIDGYLAQSEARFADIVPGTEKTVVWAYPDRRKTPVSLVYLHGFTASRRECSPLCEIVAARLGANLFFTRLAGHGRTGAALGAATVRDWQRDALEALAIGRRIGNRVIVAGASTGGCLAVWLAGRLAGRQGADDVSACLLLSPNFAPRDPAARLLALPCAELLVRLLVGRDYGWKPQNEAHARYWTTRYPSRSLVRMMRLVRSARRIRLERIRTPVLVIGSPDDRVVDWKETVRAFGRFGSVSRRIVPVLRSENPESHILAGDILAPGDTETIAGLILDFLLPLAR